MKTILVVAVLLISNLCAAQPPIPPEEWTSVAARNLARSCVAEAGFDSGTNGECAAIAFVYARRFHQMRRAGRYLTYSQLVWQYSAPLRLNVRPWVNQLNGDDRPRSMPRRWPWDQLLPKWQQLQDMVQRWARGEIENPCPGANHFGSVQDGAPAGWRRIRCNSRMRNRFWRSH